MKIAQSQLSFSTSHLATQESRTQETLRILKPGENSGLSTQTQFAASKFAFSASYLTANDSRIQGPMSFLKPEANPDEPGAGRVDISDAGRKSLQAEGTNRTGNPIRPTDNDPRLTILRMAVEMLTGRKVNISDVELRDPGNASEEGHSVHERYRSYTETEMTTFSAQGMVRTADGREISFQLDLTMFRAFHTEEYTSSVLGAKPTDPLVINFAGTAAELSDMTFKFDFFSNGEEVNMRALAPGSGFLVFDRNGDGKVNDGSELFGVKSGNGFADLAALDEDGNGWIDENDSAFSSLYIWTKSANGSDVLTSLKDAGVGALALTYANTPFSLKDANNTLLGQITDTSVFLMEKGGVGTVQKVDVVV